MPFLFGVLYQAFSIGVWVMVMKHTDWKGHGIWEQASHSDDSHINIRDNN